MNLLLNASYVKKKKKASFQEELHNHSKFQALTIFYSMYACMQIYTGSHTHTPILLIHMLASKLIAPSKID